MRVVAEFSRSGAVAEFDPDEGGPGLLDRLRKMVDDGRCRWFAVLGAGVDVPIRTDPMVEYCGFCPVATQPLVKHHPYGGAEHVVR